MKHYNDGAAMKDDLPRFLRAAKVGDPPWRPIEPEGANSAAPLALILVLLGPAVLLVTFLTGYFAGMFGP